MMEMITLSNSKKSTAAPARGVKRDVAAQRIILFSLVLLAAIIAVMALKSSSVTTSLVFYNAVLPVLIPLLACLTAGAAALWIVRHRRGVSETGTVLSGSFLTILAGGLFAVCVGYSFLSGTRLLVCMIAAASLFYIYYLYPRSFFAYAAVTLAGGLLLAFFRFGSSIFGLILPAILLAVLEVIVLMMLAGGKHRLGTLVPAEPRARMPFLITAALLLVGFVLGFVAPSLLFWAIVLLFASFLVNAIITTLRMM